MFDKIANAEACSESGQTSKMACFAEKVNGWKRLTILAKHTIFDSSYGFEYASEIRHCSPHSAPHCLEMLFIFVVEL